VSPCLNFLTKKAPYKGLGADSEEKHEPVSDIDIAVVDSLKVLDPHRPIREAEIICICAFMSPHPSALEPGFDRPSSKKS
jgi:hypothetical protein